MSNIWFATCQEYYGGPYLKFLNVKKVLCLGRVKYYHEKYLSSKVIELYLETS